MTGMRLGSWILDRELGRGGMGCVYLAHTEAGGQAAVKVLAGDLAADPEFLPRFEREIAILRQLDHPNIVRFLEAGAQDRLSWFAMEYVAGPSLETLRLERGPFSWEEVIDMGVQLAQALKHAHDRGIIHRDLKPANLLLGEPPSGRETPGANAPGSPGLQLGQVKLTDFGIASLFAAGHLTATGRVVGTAEYLSPEQAAGKSATRRSDIYSLGVVLYTLVTGRPPFAGEVVDLLHKHLYAQFDRPIRLVPDLPRDLDDLICQMLDKDPARRPADGTVLHRRLETIRRKMEFKANAATQETVERKLPGVREEHAEEGPATLMSRLMRRELEDQNRGGPIQRFLNSPWVLLPLFLLTVGIIVWTFWPLSAEGLYRRAAALLASEPDNWERAKTEYLDVLKRKYPDHPYQEEVRQLEQQIEAYEVSQEARKRSRSAGPMSEAQWFYQQGVRQRQLGQNAVARATWKSLIQAFSEVPSEAPWVRLAQERLDESNPEAKRGLKPIRQAVEHARQLRQQGKNAEADAISKAIEELYGKDRQVKEIVDRE